MNSPKAELALFLLKERCFSGVSLDEIATLLNVSRIRLRVLIKMAAGMPAGRYVKLLRMQRAQELLESTFLSVKEIMAEVGCNDQSHFVRDFKARFGVPPGRYRELIIQRNAELGRWKRTEHRLKKRLG